MTARRAGPWVIAYIEHSLLDQPGDWTLTVTDLPDPTGPSGATLRGPWTFHFTVPPASPQP